MARNASVPGRARVPAARRGTSSFRFFGEAASELRRVTWPTRQETMRLTLMVIAVSGAVGVFLFIVDLVFAELLNILLGT